VVAEPLRAAVAERQGAPVAPAALAEQVVLAVAAVRGAAAVPVDLAVL